MQSNSFQCLAWACALAGVLGVTGCDDFLAVENHSVVGSSELDPEKDAAMLSLSARQDFAVAYGYLIVYSAWFTGEALVAETFPAMNEFGRRDISTENGALLGQLWVPLSTARASADRVIQHLRGSRAGSSVDAARAALFSGYSFLFMAEHFCQGTVSGGPPLDTRMTLDSAIARFDQAIRVGRAAAQRTSGAERIETDGIVGAALVGRARAHLQAGRKNEAAESADQVPAGLVFNILYADDPSNRWRLGNRLWDLTFARGTVAVAPAFRNLGDPRVPVNPPHPSRRSADGITEFWTQAKYNGYAAPIRIASRLEADYIAAEARGVTAMLDLIQQRRAANGQPAYGGRMDAESVLPEFLEQRAREFYLEGKVLGDFRRNPGAARFIPSAGARYHKPGYDPIRDQTCYPLPAKETSNNPNFATG